MKPVAKRVFFFIFVTFQLYRNSGFGLHMYSKHLLFTISNSEEKIYIVDRNYRNFGSKFMRKSWKSEGFICSVEDGKNIDHIQDASKDLRCVRENSYEK